MPEDDGWKSFTFYNGRLIGYRTEIAGDLWEIIPTNGREGSWDVMHNDEWVGESFSSVDEAKEYVG